MQDFITSVSVNTLYINTVLTYIWMIQDLHYSNFSEELEERKQTRLLKAASARLSSYHRRLQPQRASSTSPSSPFLDRRTTEPAQCGDNGPEL